MPEIRFELDPEAIERLADLFEAARAKRLGDFIRAAGGDPDDGKIRMVTTSRLPSEDRFHATLDPRTGEVRNGLR